MFTDEALGWLRDPRLRPHLAVSRALYERLENSEAGEQFAPWNVMPDPDRVREVRDALEPIAKYSHSDAVELPEGARTILNAILESGEPIPDVVADEWAFLASHSLAVLEERTRTTLDALERAGVHVYEITRREMKRGLRALRRRIPRRLLRVMKGVGRFPGGGRERHFIVAAGEFALAMIPHVALPLGAANLIQQFTGVIAGDP